MTPALQIYFQAEKKAAMLFAVTGILACWAGGSMFLKAAAPFYIGLALPLLALGILQIIVGTTVTRRSDQQVEDLEQLIDSEPLQFRQDETLRLGKIMRNFTVIRWIEIGFLVIGTSLFFWQREFLFSKGLGLGLACEGLLMLIADYFAEKRAVIYQTFVEQTGKTN